MKTSWEAPGCRIQFLRRATAQDLCVHPQVRLPSLLMEYQALVFRKSIRQHRGQCGLIRRFFLQIKEKYDKDYVKALQKIKTELINP